MAGIFKFVSTEYNIKMKFKHVPYNDQVNA